MTTPAALAYLRIAEGEPFPDVAAFAPFRAVVVLEADYGEDWQNAASEWLVESGCLYMMAWGDRATTWDDSVDWAVIRAFPAGIPEERFVYTTWHDDEPLEETFWFAGFCATHSVVALERTLIVHVALEDRRDALIARFCAAQAED